MNFNGNRTTQPNKLYGEHWLRPALFVAGAAILLLLALLFSPQLAPVNAAADQPSSDPSAPAQTNSVYLPVAFNDAGITAYRIGYGAANSAGNINRYPGVRDMLAGWYTDWTVRVAPIRPSGIEYAQMIRLHQKLSCGKYYEHDRTACPYTQPLDYVFYPDKATIEAAAKANPGSTWLVGNEMDRIDWQNCVQFDASGKCTKVDGSLGQDEMLPATYAKAYHDMYTIVKAADPTAKVAIGGVIQATPLRLQWLTLAWDSYKTQFGADMPVDVWNVHNFILAEKKGGFGSEVPAGLPGNPTQGEYTTDAATHVDKTIFGNQIRAMRQWMKDRGQQQKPLVVSEYGVLYDNCVKVVNGKCTVDLNNSQTVNDFMVWTFDYYLNTKDCNLGPSNDECRLVQRWLWFSLDHTGTQPNGTVLAGGNKHGALFDNVRLTKFPAADRFRQFVVANLGALSQKPQ